MHPAILHVMGSLIFFVTNLHFCNDFAFKFIDKIEIKREKLFLSLKFNFCCAVLNKDRLFIVGKISAAIFSSYSDLFASTNLKSKTKRMQMFFLRAFAVNCYFKMCALLRLQMAILYSNSSHLESIRHRKQKSTHAEHQWKEAIRKA